MNHTQKTLLPSVLALVLAVALCAATAPTSANPGNPPPHLKCSGWNVVPDPNAAGEPLGVTAVSASDVWAVGVNVSRQTLTEHWNGTSWKVIPSPTPPSIIAILNSVTAISANDLWAVGYIITSQGHRLTLIEHWNGKSWQLVSSPNPSANENYLDGVASVSTTDDWAVGYSYGRIPGYSTLIEHWNGTQWSIVKSPNPTGSTDNELKGVVALSATDVWAVGRQEQYIKQRTVVRNLTEQWNGKNWNIVPIPSAGPYNNNLYAVAAITSHNLWTVGSHNVGSSGPKTTTLQWNGTKWRLISSPNGSGSDNEFFGVASISATDVWAVGYYLVPFAAQYALIAHWNGTQWTLVLTPAIKSATLYAVAHVPATHQLWAVGSYNNGNYEPLLVHYCP